MTLAYYSETIMWVFLAGVGLFAWSRAKSR